jgi:hypothetical protein
LLAVLWSGLLGCCGVGYPRCCGSGCSRCCWKRLLAVLWERLLAVLWERLLAVLWERLLAVLWKRFPAEPRNQLRTGCGAVYARSPGISCAPGCGAGPTEPQNRLYTEQ